MMGQVTFKIKPESSFKHGVMKKRQSSKNTANKDGKCVRFRKRDKMGGASAGTI